MVRGIIIPAVSFLPIEEREFSGLKDYQDAVGGYIEPISIEDPAITLYVNEDGRSRAMSLNEHATALWWLHVPAVRGSDAIVGDAVLLPEGPASESLLVMLQRSRGFHVEVQLVELVGEWIEGPRNFPTWFEAAKFALILEQRLEFVSAARVTSD